MGVDCYAILKGEKRAVYFRVPRRYCDLYDESDLRETLERIDTMEDEIDEMYEDERLWEVSVVIEEGGKVHIEHFFRYVEFLRKQAELLRLYRKYPVGLLGLVSLGKGVEFVSEFGLDKELENLRKEGYEVVEL